jgi:hypothetical protein
MKNKRKEKEETINKERCRNYLVRGALLWGPLYTTGVSGMVFAAAPVLSVEPSSYSEVLLNSALICPSLGAAGGYLRWRLARGGARENRSRPLRLRIGRKASHRKAA